MGCQAHKAYAPEEASKAPPNRTLLTGPKHHFQDGNAGVRKGPQGSGEAFPGPKPRSTESAEGRAADEEQRHGDDCPERKPSLAPSTTSLSGRGRSTSAYSSSFSTSMSATPASARSNMSRQTRTSWAMGHVQEEGCSPLATPSAALTARRIITEENLPDVTPRVHCPECLWLVAPQRSALQGMYERLPDALANGEPIWRQADGEGWLFSCSTGFWMVADHREKVERNLAQLRTVDRHYARLPHECGRWMYGEDSRNWVTDIDQTVFITPDRERALVMVKHQGEQAAGRVAEAARRALEAPEALWLAAPPKPFLQGEYRKVAGWMEDDMPVWRQVTGDCCILSTSGHWVVCESQVDDVRKRAQIRSSVPHGGEWPEQTSMWKYSNTMRGWTTDYVRAVCVSTDPEAAERSQANYMYLQGDEEMDCDEKLETAFANVMSPADSGSLDEENASGWIDSV